jgi:hypothetical protein
MKKDEIYNVIEYLRKGNLLNDELQDLINNSLIKTVAEYRGNLLTMFYCRCCQKVVEYG